MEADDWSAKLTAENKEPDTIDAGGLSNSLIGMIKKQEITMTMDG